MKTKILVPAFAFIAFLVLSSCAAHTHTHTTTVVHHPPVPRSVTVHTWSNDISNNLDLRAVASIFATSRNLREFEMRLNDPRLGISNLDLNRDGFVDYLRAIEVFDRRTPNTRLVVIQAVLGFNVFQDVATIVVEGRNSRNAVIYVIGDPWLFGRNYVIAPVFHHPPVIFGSFWGPTHVVWHSPYHWGHFPPTFVSSRPIVITNVYITNIYVNNVINVNDRFNYRTSVRNQQTVTRMQNEVSRNDFARTNPNESFNNRNAGVTNTREMQVRDQNAAGTRQPAQQQPRQGVQQQPAQQQPRQGVQQQPAQQQPRQGVQQQPAQQQPRQGVQQQPAQQQPRQGAQQQPQQQTQPRQAAQQQQPQQQQPNNVRQTQTQQQNRQAAQPAQQNTRQTNTEANQGTTTNRR